MYSLRYELNDGKVVDFKFNEDIDYEKYNQTILDLYGKRITKRYVVVDDKKMSLRAFRNYMSGLHDT